MREVLLSILLLAPAAAEAADFCSQIEGLGVVGKHVAVTVSLGDEHRTHTGRLLDIEGQVLTLDPQPGEQGDIEPLREGGKIIEPVKTRVYLNCAHITSLTVDPAGRR